MNAAAERDADIEWVSWSAWHSLLARQGDAPYTISDDPCPWLMLWEPTAKGKRLLVRLQAMGRALTDVQAACLAEACAPNAYGELGVVPMSFSERRRCSELVDKGLLRPSEVKGGKYQPSPLGRAVDYVRQHRVGARAGTRGPA